MFTPFKEPSLKDLKGEHLAVLRETSEGWYVEYKETAINADSIGKSVSAFANSRGGWLFYGISAPSSTVGFASDFPGLPTSALPGFLQRIRDAISQVDPVPYFEVRALDGPEPAVGLAGNSSVVVVHVPAGARPPYVHRNGRIYVRAGDKSEPVPETDRGRLQVLFDRTAVANAALSRFLDSVPAGRTEQPFLQLFLMRDPFDDRRWTHEIELRQFAQLMNAPPDATSTNPLPFSMPFGVTQSLGPDLWARSAGPGLTNGVSWRFTRAGHHAVTVPLMYTEVEGTSELKSYLHGYEFSDRFTAAWERAQPGRVRLIDLSIVAAALSAIFRTVEAIQSVARFPEPSRPLYAKAILRNVGLAIPFIDTVQFVDHVEEFGIPMTHDSDMVLPSDEHGQMLALPLDVGGKPAPLMDALFTTVVLARAFGLPWWYDRASRLGKAEEEVQLFAAWIALVVRAQEVMARRNQQRAR